MLIQEIRARRIIGKSGLGDGSMSVNPFVGCSHACVYCYAVFMKRFTDHHEPWGSFVDVKVNAADLFPADYRRLKEGNHLFFGSVTDVYQPTEKKFGLMRGILKFLAERSGINAESKGAENESRIGKKSSARSKPRRPSSANYFPEMIDSAETSPPCAALEKRIRISILTKSDLVLRDIDLIRQIPSISVGFSIAMPDERARRIFEPGASPVAARLTALERLHAAGIRTFVFINPVLPHITPLETIFRRIGPSADSVFGESLNFHCGNLTQIYDAVRRYDPDRVEPFRQGIRDPHYWSEVKKRFFSLAKENRIPCDGFHVHGEPSTERDFS